MNKTKENNCFNGSLPLTTTIDELYEYFIKNVYDVDLKINGTKVNFFTTPVVDNKMQGFFHITTKTQKKLGMAIRMTEPRAYFINHIVPMINNYLKCSTCNNVYCNKIKIWTAPFKNTKRTKLLYNDDKYAYIIILESKKNVMYVISAYLVDEPGKLEKILKEYNKYKKTS